MYIVWLQQFRKPMHTADGPQYAHSNVAPRVLCNINEWGDPGLPRQKLVGIDIYWY
jgi:hypothetical protein